MMGREICLSNENLRVGKRKEIVFMFLSRWRNCDVFYELTWKLKFLAGLKLLSQIVACQVIDLLWCIDWSLGLLSIFEKKHLTTNCSLSLSWIFYGAIKHYFPSWNPSSYSPGVRKEQYRRKPLSIKPPFPMSIPHGGDCGKYYQYLSPPSSSGTWRLLWKLEQ